MADRIVAITTTADRIISTGDLTQRIADSDYHDDTASTGLGGTLNRMFDEIETLMHSVRTASDNIAHDLRHPLTRLRNRIEDMREDAERGGCDVQKQKLSDLVNECDALLSTFQAILRISNIESARRHGGFREVNLNALLQDILELYEPVAADKKITLAFDALPTRTIGDKDLLFQAVANLLDNAIKYTPIGGSITITLAPEGNGGILRIADSGPGIADEHKTSVFRRFFRVDAARNQPGTGLGLSLVGAIVKLHQGTITLSDNVPHGLVVKVTL
jgi:signal transduction histidine kinase